MAKILWTQGARKDLLRLREFLAVQSEEAAGRAVRSIREGLETLRRAPDAGKVVDWLPGSYREWVIPFGNSAYLLLYRVQDGRVVIQALRHGRESGYKRT